MKENRQPKVWYAVISFCFVQEQTVKICLYGHNNANHSADDYMLDKNIYFWYFLARICSDLYYSKLNDVLYSLLLVSMTKHFLFECALPLNKMKQTV